MTNCSCLTMTAAMPAMGSHPLSNFWLHWNLVLVPTSASFTTQLSSTSGDGESSGTEIPAPPRYYTFTGENGARTKCANYKSKFSYSQNKLFHLLRHNLSLLLQRQSVVCRLPAVVSPVILQEAKAVGAVVLSNTNKLNRIKKPKPKSSAQKSKVIKFHEYKGPPNVVKNQQVPTSTSQQACVPAAPATTEQAAFSQTL